MTVRGIVKGNSIVLDNGASLPEGATVEVRLLAEPAISREEAFAAMLRHREQNRGLRVGIDEIIEEEKQDREEPESPAHELAVLSASALAEDWNHPEEDVAWSHLQPAK